MYQIRHNKFYTSICLLAKNENNYINEWLDWHLNKLKFDHVYIYDNESDIPIIDSVDKIYHDRITFLVWRKCDYGLIMQDACYRHFIRTFKNENKWVAFIDADEFIRTIDNIPINDFLIEYEPYNGLFIEWLMYNANGQYLESAEPVRERFKTTIDYSNKPFTGKCIIKVNEFTDMFPHWPKNCTTQYKVVDSDKKIYYPTEAKTNSPSDKIVIDHYFTKSYEEWHKKLARGSCHILKRRLEEFFDFNPDMKLKEDE